MINHYETLQVPEDATASRIKSSYKRLALQHHPDRNPNNPLAEENFKQINGAYQVLSDPYMRSVYDAQLEDARRPKPQYQEAEAEAENWTRPNAFSHNKWQHEKYPVKQRVRDNVLGIVITVSIFAALFGLVGYTGYQSAQIRKAQLIKEAQLRDAFFSTVYGMIEKDEWIKARTTLLEVIKPKLSHIASEEVKTILSMELKSMTSSIEDQLRKKAAEAYHSKDYVKAINRLELCLSLNSIDSTLGLGMLVESAIGIRDHEKAAKYVDVYDLLEHDKVKIWHRKAKIAYMLPDNEASVYHCFEKAGIASEAYLTTVLGEAYMLVMTPEDIPNSHYDMSRDHCHYLIQNGGYAKALRVSEWMTTIRPFSGEAKFIQGNILSQLGQQAKACVMWEAAAHRKSERAKEKLAEYCR